jgi:hypothetical protein
VSGDAIGRALLPSGDYNYYKPSFEADDEWKAFYPTRIGAVGLNYTPNNRPHYVGDDLMLGTGMLTLVLFDTTHEVQDARTYQITYREPRIR